MKQLILILISITLITSCQKEETQPKEITEADKIADSLQAVADSIAMMRNLHSMRTGKHLHQDQDLAAVAHQDPKKKARFKKAQYKGTPAKRLAAEKRNARLKQQMEAIKKQKGIVDPEPLIENKVDTITKSTPSTLTDSVSQ